jgi:predicted metal-dependent hydrolase
MPAKRTLGSYSQRTNTIRINPVLDRKTVPAYFIEFIVYHEMLHADMGVGRINGRRSVHSSGFRIREKLFKKYEQALAWENNIYI